MMSNVNAGMGLGAFRSDSASNKSLTNLAKKINSREQIDEDMHDGVSVEDKIVNLPSSKSAVFSHGKAKAKKRTQND